MTLPAFRSFSRGAGRPGVRNQVAIVSVMDNCNPATRAIAQQVAGCIAVTTLYVRGQFGDDLAFTYGVLASLGANPNVHSVVLVGLEEASTDKVVALLREKGKHVERVTLQPRGTTASIAEGVRLAQTLVLRASQAIREDASATSLSVGVVSSCVTQAGAQALHAQIGRAVDALVASGATVVLGQTAAFAGLQEPVIARGASPTIVGDINVAFESMRSLLAGNGGGEDAGLVPWQRAGDDRHPRAVGEAQLLLMGQQQVCSVLRYGEPPAKPGMHWMPTPRGVAETLTAFAAAGCQVLVHAIDEGPAMASAVAPTLCVGTHGYHSSVDASPGKDDLLHRILDVADGSATRSELLGLGQTAISRFARSG